MIEFRNIHKSFGTKKVLNGLNLKIKHGEIFTILGRSGTGKSVTLKHLVGLLRADQGEIYLDDFPVHQANEKDFQWIRRKCGLVFQLPTLLDSRNLYENLSLGIRKVPFKERLARCEAALKAVHLENLWPDLPRKYPPQLSYGEQKRLSLARTLVTEPDYLLFDEPTTGLDPVTSRAIFKLIRHVSQNFGKTSIVVSHDMSNSLQSADRIAVMHAGQVIDMGSPEEIKKSQVPLTRDFLLDLNLEQKA